jgi:hypothetical protein
LSLYDADTRFKTSLTEQMFCRRHYGIQKVTDDFPEIVGIHIGGCIHHFGRWHLGNGMNGAEAHAHIQCDRYRGWICYTSPTIFFDPQYEWVFWHEYAHILADQFHTPKWRRIMRELDKPIWDTSPLRQNTA